MYSILVMTKCREDIREVLKERYGEMCNFIFAENREDVTENQLKHADVIIGEPEEEQLEKALNLKWLQLTWAGADKYVQMNKFPENVVLCNVSGAFGTIISEYVIGALVAQYRNFAYYMKNQQQHIWKRMDSEDTIAGKKVLILGMGDIGSNIARRLKTFDTSVVGIKRTISGCEHFSEFDEVCDIRQLDSLLPDADVVIGCLPGTKETKGLLNLDRLYRMKQNALLVNVGRGSLIVNADLVKVLSEGHLRGVVLDVSESEPLEETSPLWNMDNVILTPHISGPSFGKDMHTSDTIWKICMDNLERFLNGQKLSHVVNRELGY